MGVFKIKAKGTPYLIFLTIGLLVCLLTWCGKIVYKSWDMELMKWESLFLFKNPILYCVIPMIIISFCIMWKEYNKR